jgi:putative membrane protein
MPKEEKKALVLCIDRDDDIGKKSGVKGPIVGRESILKAAQGLALADPAESDLNAMFEAVRVYDEIKKENPNVEVAVVVGHPMRGYRADKRLSEQLDDLLEKHNVKGVVVVTDGADDEQILSLVESRTKVLSVRTIIVKQTKELEKGYYVIKELLRDPHFARIIFGLPGLIAVVYVIVSFLEMAEFALNAVIGVVGFYLVLKGFGIEDKIIKAMSDFSKTFAIERASFPIYFVGGIFFLFGLWAGYDAALQMNIQARAVSESIIQNGMVFIGGSLWFFSISGILFLAGRMGDMYYRAEYHKIKKYALSIVSVIVAFIILDQSIKFALFWLHVAETGPKPTDLLFTFILGFVVFIVGFGLVSLFYTRKYISQRLQLNQEVKDNEGKRLGMVNYIDRKSRYFTYPREETKEKVKVPFSRVVLIRDAVVIKAH